MRVKETVVSIFGFLEKEKSFVIILLLATFLRLFKIRDLTTFLADQGYQFLQVKLMLVDYKWTLLGPKTSIADLYLGPIYYYILLPVLAIWRLDPIGPAVFTAVLGLATLILLYKFAKEHFNLKVALIACAFYAFSPQVVEYSRSALNPYLIPFFTVVILCSLGKIIEGSKDFYVILIGISLGIIIQLHYLTFPFLILAPLFLVLSKIRVRPIYYFWSLVSFLIVVSPFLAFEFRHNFFNTKMFFGILTEGTVTFSLLDQLSNFVVLPLDLFRTLLSNGNLLISWLLFIIIGLGLIRTFLNKGEKKNEVYSFLLFLFFGFIFGISFYKGEFFLHYQIVVFPIFFLLFALGASYWFKSYKILTIIGLSLLLTLNLFQAAKQLSRNQGWDMPLGWNMKGVEKASKIITEDVGSKSFNIAATLDGDTRAWPYRYFLEIYGKKPLDVEEYPQAQVLYVISREDSRGVLKHAEWEISSFENKKLTGVWEIQNDINLYKIIHDEKN